MSFPQKVLLTLAIFSLGILFAQTPGLSSASDEELGSFLTTSDGHSVYATLEDAPEAEGCDEACAAYWPPVTPDSLGEAGEGFDSGLLGEVERADGTTQVTYNGWPLYRFHYDFDAGSTRGQGIVDLWYLVSPEGELVGYSPADEEAAEEETADGAEEVEVTDEFAQLMQVGEEVYARVCMSCHGPGGEGGAGVRLIDNSRLADAHGIADAVTHGLAYMPPLGGLMTAEETQAVLTFIRNSWDNDFGEVPLEVVQEVRGE